MAYIYKLYIYIRHIYIYVYMYIYIYIEIAKAPKHLLNATEWTNCFRRKYLFHIVVRKHLQQ